MRNIHSFYASQGTVFFHNGDFSGEVIVRVPESKNEDQQEVEVPFEDLKEFVAKYICSEKISKLEDAEPDEILGL